MMKLKKIIGKKTSNIFEGVATGSSDSRQIKWWFGLLDLALLVTILLLPFVESELLLIFVFFFLTLGAFYWEFRAFVLRSGFWVAVTTVLVLVSLRSSEVYVEELIEIPVLSGILALVYVIAGQRKRAEEALRDANQDLENRVAERTVALTRLNEELVQEITEHKRTEATLRESEGKLRTLGQAERNQRRLAEALVQAVIALNTSLDLDEVLDHILEQTQRVIPCRAANIMQVEGETICITRRRGFEDLPGVWGTLETSFPLDSFPMLKTMSLSSQPLAVVDTHTEPGWSSAPGFEWVRSYAAAPLQTGEQIIGFLNIFSEQPGFFSQEIADRLNAFAAHAVVAIRNARLYKDLENLLEQEQAMRDQLVQAEKLTAMGRMVASIAHELNNPLQIIKNCLFLIQREIAPDAPVYDYLDTSSSEIERLSNLVAQLREVYRPHTADAVQPLELLKILEETHFLLTPHLQQQRVRWEQTPGAKDFVVKGVADQLKQVFLNISLNAIEAMQPAGGTLFVEQVVATGSSQVGVVFRDAGPGISPENMSELFEPFFTTKKAGTGLGLSISYDIVRTHGGRISVDSQPGAGATFTVWLPLATMEEQASPDGLQDLKVEAQRV